MGTPAYMPPEQLAGDAVDARGDQFAFCVVAWECLFGERPFGGSTLAALALAIERQELKRSARNEVPPRVRAVIERGLRPDPAARYGDMRALLTALRDAVTGRRRRRVVAAVVALVLAGGATAAAASFVVRRDRPCAIGDDAFVDAWDPLLQDRVGASFAETGVADAVQIFGRVADAVDGYRHAWIGMRRDACEATRVRGEQSETMLDLRMRCLDRKRDDSAR